MLAARDLVYYPPTAVAPPWPPLRFDTHDARFVLLSGPSGSGKSTLLRVLCGLLPGFRGGRLDGEVSILGRPVSGRPDGRVGMLFQNADAMLHSPRVADELLARAPGARPAHDRNPAADRGHAWLDEVVEAFELGGILERRIVELSGGEQQRVALAAVLATRPEVVLLDEPTSNLDPAAAAALVKLIVRCGERFGTRFVAAEHRADHLLHLIDGALHLAASASNGCVQWSGSPGAVPLEALPGQLDLAAVRGLANADRGAVSDRPLLTCRNLSCHRAGRRVLDHLDFELQAGEIVGLTGPNGVGKSTLLLLLAGGLKTDSGSQITWTPGSTGNTRQAQVGLLLQNPLHQLFCETVREEVALAADNGGLDRDGRHMDRLLAAADLADLANRQTLTLSYGEQQRTALAAAMSARPPVVLLDEPTHGMDAMRLGKLIRFLIEARRDGTAFVVASHDRPLLEAFCDRVLSIQNGRLQPTGTDGE